MMPPATAWDQIPDVDTRYRDALRKLTVQDDRFVESTLAHADSDTPSPLDPKTRALVCLGALVALDAATPSYQWAVDRALATGATPDELVDTLLAIMPTAGVPRVTAAAPRLALALGYDAEADIEQFDSEDPR